MSTEEAIFILTGLIVLVVCVAGVWITHQTVPTSTAQLKVAAMRYFAIFGLVGLAVVYMLFVFTLSALDGK